VSTNAPLLFPAFTVYAKYLAYYCFLVGWCFISVMLIKLEEPKTTGEECFMFCCKYCYNLDCCNILLLSSGVFYEKLGKGIYARHKFCWLMYKATFAVCIKTRISSLWMKTPVFRLCLKTCVCPIVHWPSIKTCVYMYCIGRHKTHVCGSCIHENTCIWSIYNHSECG